MKRVITLILFLILCKSAFAQTTSPKREYRGAWISTVTNIDWPKSRSSSTEQNKSELIEILDYLKDANINNVVFQVRPTCDALYASEIEPWSYWLTGRQGKAPSPFFDPLEFAIEEAHKRGMELHAWFNPYRVAYDSYGMTLDPQNIAVKNPDWVLRIDDKTILDPGMPQVREHVLSVIMDVVKRYDVDGIHFDDYFYVQGITTQDDHTFETYNENGITNKGDWRRDNVNELLRMIYASIQEEAPHVKFGQSPGGIWKTGEPTGIFGRSTYSAIYCDPVAWLNEQIIDYLTPQLYWPFGGGQDYGALMPWWVEQRNDRHILPGLPIYRVGQTGFDGNLMGDMIDLNRATEGCQGQTFFTAHDFKDNPLNTTTSLKENQFKYKAIIPSMDWKEQDPPSAPTELRFDRVSELGTTALTWNKPPEDDVARYVIYASSSILVNIDDPKNIYDITSKNYYLIDEDFPKDAKYYVVTALDRNNNESAKSNTFMFQPSTDKPSVPLLIAPLNNIENARDTVQLKWNYALYASSYSLEVAPLPDFTVFTYKYEEILDTTFSVTDLDGDSTYYWRVKAINHNGESDYSEVFTFKTAFPSKPTLSYPTDLAIEVELNPTIIWNSITSAKSYQLQLFEGLSTNSENIVFNENLTDTTFTSDELKSGTFYTWRVRVTNQYGTGKWSQYKFKTKIIIPAIPEKVYPQNEQDDIRASLEIKWKNSDNADRYDFQFSEENDFSPYLILEKDLSDTTFMVNDLEGEKTYYWRVRGVNNGGKSDYSETFSFTTGFPLQSNLVYPSDLLLDVELDPILRWSSSEVAEQYQVQLSSGVSINLNDLIIDTLVTDTSLYILLEDVNTIYSWRVKSFNDVGESDWTAHYKFKTNKDYIISTEEENNIPNSFELYQNYPNPFNPSTNISYDIAEATKVSLKVYNLLGQEIKSLVNEIQATGKYKVHYDAQELSSGIYIYELRAGSFVSSRKLVFIK